MHKTPIVLEIAFDYWQKMDNIRTLNQIKIQYYLESQNPSFMKAIKGVHGMTIRINSTQLRSMDCRSKEAC